MKQTVIQTGPPDSEETADSMLDACEQLGIFAVHEEGGFFFLVERCDNYFEIKVTPEQLRLLGRELIALTDAPPQNHP